MKNLTQKGVLNMTTGQKIKILRKKHGLTQTELGERLGVQKNAVSKWECGRVVDIPAGKIRAMAEMFDVPTSYLVDEDAVYVSPNDGRVQVSEEDIKFALFGGDGEITDEMYQEVQLFASFIKAREAAKKKE